MTDQPEPTTSLETYYVGAYWGPREEKPEDCARRASRFLTLLATCDPLLAHWNKIPKPRGRGKKTPLMPPDLPFLAEAFRRGVNREPGGPAIKQLGFRVSAYNDGKGQDHASVRMGCGCYSEFVSNACVLNLPWEGASSERLITPTVLTKAVHSMAVAWEPDWSVAISHSFRDLDEEFVKDNFLVGWITYLSRRMGTVPPLPAPVRVEPVGDQGTLIILTPERFTVSNPDHVALARRVRELLAHAGLLRPRAS